MTQDAGDRAIQDVQPTPERGNIIWVALDPDKRHEQGGWRPFLVLTPFEHQRALGRVSGLPVTSKIRDVMTEVPISGLKVPSVAQIDQIMTLDIVSRTWKSKGETATQVDLARAHRAASAFLGG